MHKACVFVYRVRSVPIARVRHAACVHMHAGSARASHADIASPSLHAVPYVYGAAGGSSCPAGFKPIDEEAACRTAAAAVNGRFSEVEADEAAPGCVSDDMMDVLFNTNSAPLGIPCETCRRLCMGAPTHSRALVLCARPDDPIPHVMLVSSHSCRLATYFDGCSDEYSSLCGTLRFPTALLYGMPTGGCS